MSQLTVPYTKVCELLKKLLVTKFKNGGREVARIRAWDGLGGLKCEHEQKGI